MIVTRLQECPVARNLTVAPTIKWEMPVKICNKCWHRVNDMKHTNRMCGHYDDYQKETMFGHDDNLIKKKWEMSFTGMSYKQHQGLQEWIASKLVMLMIWVVCNDYKLHVFGKLANCQGTMFPTVLGKNMMQTECCISRCDNLTKKEQDKPSCNTGKQVSSKNITVASVKLVQHLPIKIKEINCNIGWQESKHSSWKCRLQDD